MRMRRRRVERCLLRASVALEAGVIEDAREALAEAEQLAPGDPDVQTLRDQLARPEPRPLPPPPPPTPSAADFQIREAPPPLEIHEIPARRSRRLPVAAVLLIPLSAAAGWYATRGTPVSSVPPPLAVTPPAAVAETPIAKSEPPSVTVAESSITVPVATSPEPPGSTDPVATSGSALNAAPSPAASPVAAGRTTEPPARARDDGARTSALPAPAIVPSVTRGFGNTVPEPAPTETRPLAAPPESTAPVVSGAEGIAAPDSAVKLAAPPVAAPPPQASAQPVSNLAPPPNTTRNEEQNIRTVLGRYESAYSRLDAAAAGAVWPGVNQRALANAFDGLSAQSISLGQCDVRVNGNTAQANCTGTARWTPKVGGGSQSAARQWRFDLRNASNGWVITQAVIR